MGVIDNAVSWALSIAKDDSHGYDQSSRWGPDYDCSSLVIQAYENAGVPVKSNGASYTGDMVQAFKNCGFKDVTSSITLSSGSGLIKGDVVWKSGHVEMVSRVGYLVGASINENGETTGGATGDQTGNEIRERTYYNSPWTIVLRYPETSSDSVSKDDVISKNAYLTLAEMQVNARYIYQYFSAQGWTLNAIAGMLGNMQTESTINPGIWQNLDKGNTSLGFGLVQWTPATKILEYLDNHGFSDTDIEGQCQRIVYEKEHGLQYIMTDSYPMSFLEFSISSDTPEYLAYVFLNNYERPSNKDQPNRKTQARYWYDYLLNYADSGESESGAKKRKGYNFVLFGRRKRNGIF